MSWMRRKTQERWTGYHRLPTLLLLGHTVEKWTPQFLSSHGNTPLPSLSRCGACPSAAAAHWDVTDNCVRVSVLSPLNVPVFFFLNMYGCFACMRVCALCVLLPQRPEEGVGSSGAEVKHCS